MSQYFRVLRRLETDPDRGAPPHPIAPKVEPQGVVPAPQQAERSPAPLAHAVVSPAYAMLYENLRATANGEPTRCLVFAGATSTDRVRSVTRGLAAHVRRLGLRVIVAELVRAKGRPVLRARPEECDEPVGLRESMPLDLRSHAGAAGVTSWLEESSGHVDLVLIEGSAFAQSIDSALVGCACDGLVIVAQSEVTPRDALHLAAERARAVGCRPIGIVMQGSADRLPRWIRRLFHHSRTPLTASEGS